MSTATVNEDFNQHLRDGSGVGPLLNAVLAPLASLKFTVALLAMAIFIILAGTLAQVDKDIWQVIDEYFRTSIAWVEFRLFLPPSFWKAFTSAPMPTIPGSFPFPGGQLIGTAMALNLLAAHLIRFKVQARGWPLISGLLVILAGMVLTSLVVTSANNSGGLQAQPWLTYDALWWCLVGSATAGYAALLAYWWVSPLRQKELVWVTGAGLVTLGVGTAYLIWMAVRGERLSDSAMRILWQLTQGGGVGLLLLVGCALVFKKRAGVVLLHAGIGLMMFGELLVGLTAVEGQLQMQEGETVNYVQDIRTVELAIVDRSDEKVDKVTVIPKGAIVSAAENKRKIRDERLPFEIEIKQFLQNAALRKVRGGDTNLATRGHGLEYFVEDIRPGSGTDMDSKVDLSAAYVTFRSKSGEDLGTYLLGLVFSAQNETETVTVDNQTYQVSLRFKRSYKPYKFQLTDVRKDDYIGTDTPRNYSSDVRLVDETRNVDRTLRIWMNNPLRFAGETFYQSGYHRDPMTQIEGTTLQVVTNTGWMIPYVSCMIVAIGMLSHFLITLSRFLNRVDTPTMSFAGSRGTMICGVVAFALCALAVLMMVSRSASPKVKAGEFDLEAFGSIPVVADGRTKPLDTVARSSLLVISSGKQTFNDHNDKSQPAIRWLLDVMAKPEVCFKHKVFRIENPEVQQLLGLEWRERFRYSPEEFLPKLQKLTEQAELAHKQDKANVSVYQGKILELEKKIGILDLLLQSFSPPNIRPESAREDLMSAMSRQQALRQRHPPLVIPPAEKGGEWDTFATGWTRNLVKSTFLKQEVDEPSEAMTRILVAYASNKPEDFNNEVYAYKAWLKEHRPDDLTLTKIDFESFFNRLQPFFTAQMLYVTAFVFGMLALLGVVWPTWGSASNRMAIGIAAVAFVLHCFALGARIYISGRPPVTNLYSSAVFIGWGCAVVGFILSMVYRNGLGMVIGTAAAFLSLGIANQLSLDGDTFVVLQAVLDTQFWLATHVTCISFGYATTYLAGLLGIAYVFLGMATPLLNQKLARDLYNMIYGTLCFSIFFSFVGTVLGGLWADDSWGRFWGWDPKENGALMIVLWNALCLHARWGGMVKARGLALLTIAGNIVVSWSWFGVNELGIGLHAYGQTEGRLFALSMSCLFFLAVIGVGLVPTRSWWSEGARPSSPKLTA
ncbi:MAG: cytochrome c biogenesis protein CcsA [Planctomycetaceae bacterium]|nr:cytochrome c biogenesis protein CcsA [Planctomycetaceae bacterium]